MHAWASCSTDKHGNYTAILIMLYMVVLIE